jgi:hypothetical protein
MADPLEIIQQIEASEGERIHRKMEALRAAFFVFVGNRRFSSGLSQRRNRLFLLGPLAWCPEIEVPFRWEFLRS